MIGVVMLFRLRKRILRVDLPLQFHSIDLVEDRTFQLDENVNILDAAQAQCIACFVKIVTERAWAEPIIIYAIAVQRWTKCTVHSDGIDSFHWNFVMLFSIDLAIGSLESRLFFVKWMSLFHSTISIYIVFI